MRVFKEYLLDEKSFSEQLIYLPTDAEIVNVLKTSEGVALITIVKHTGYESPTELHKFKICAKDEIFYVNTVKYIGSFESTLGIKHVIKVD